MKLMTEQADLGEVATKIVNAGAVEVRDVDAGEQPFVYSSGNRGPSYVMIKGLVGQRQVLKFLTAQLALKIAPLHGQHFDFIDGNATGGMIPAYDLADRVEEVLGMEPGSLPYVYLRGTRKEGGHGELITGDRRNQEITLGMSALVMEELVNYAVTTCNAANIFREAGYNVSHAACILTYDHDASNRRLAENNVTLVPLITLPQLLDAADAEGLIQKDAVQSCLDYLADTVKWQLTRGLVIPEAEAKIAQENGYNMRKLSREEALELGAPKERVDTFTYFAEEK